MRLNSKQKRQIRQWINALRSGEYKQTTETLQDRDGFCCLGVACDLFIPAKNKLLEEDGTLCGGIPAEQYKAPKWLKNIDQDFTDRQRYADIHSNHMEEVKPFVDLNDNDRMSFDEISDIIEAVYLLNVLD